jgi:ABC-type antimicrobial peptide transport system permease subunit
MKAFSAGGFSRSGSTPLPSICSPGSGCSWRRWGIYGSVAYAVTQRHREIGIRIAIGADGGRVLALVARRGVLIAAGGISLGMIGALALTRVLRSFLLGTSVMNPWVFAGAALLMMAVALIATFLPARHATRVDPVVALRVD